MLACSLKYRSFFVPPYGHYLALYDSFSFFLKIFDLLFCCESRLMCGQLASFCTKCFLVNGLLVMTRPRNVFYGKIPSLMHVRWSSHPDLLCQMRQRQVFFPLHFFTDVLEVISQVLYPMHEEIWLGLSTAILYFLNTTTKTAATVVHKQSSCMN